MTDSEWGVFENLMRQFAQCEADASKADQYDHAPPTQVVRDLEVIDRALTSALQDLAGLCLEHRDGQDISETPFNWPVVSALKSGWLTQRLCARKLAPGEGPPGEYPTDVICMIRELRDASREAIEENKPGRGNSSARSSDTARAASLAKNFVFHHRARFGDMPPMSKAGRAVDLLNEMFKIAGMDDKKDAAEYLKKAIQHDKAGTAWVVRKRSK